MAPVAFLPFAREATGSFAGAGLVLGALTAGGGLFAPLRGRLVDRRGADRAVRELTLPGLVTDVALILAGRAHAPAGLLVAMAFVSGATVAPVGTGTRTVWSARIADAGDRQAAYGLMTAIGEVSFFSGPLLAGLLVAVSPTLGRGGLGRAGAGRRAAVRDDRGCPRARPDRGDEDGSTRPRLARHVGGRRHRRAVRPDIRRVGRRLPGDRRPRRHDGGRRSAVERRSPSASAPRAWCTAGARPTGPPSRASRR
jgi:hypothetical protein